MTFSFYVWIENSISSSLSSSLLSWELLKQHLNHNNNNNNIQHAFWNGFSLSIMTFVVTIILEVISYKTWFLLYQNNPTLYRYAVMANVRNHFIYGIVIYMIATLLFLPQQEQQEQQELLGVQDKNNNENNENNMEINHLLLWWLERFVMTQQQQQLQQQVLCETIVLLIFQSIWFYSIHKIFHTCPNYYIYHKFHHQFHIHVTPMVANAVSTMEYMIGYIMPFAIACIIWQPLELSLQYSILIVSIMNLFIHTPIIELWSQQIIPSWLVSTHDHLEHHRKLHVHYAAPTLNVDWILDKLYHSLLFYDTGKTTGDGEERGEGGGSNAKTSYQTTTTENNNKSIQR